MSLADLADDAVPVVQESVAPTVPRPGASPDRVLPILIVASLIIHATIMLPSLLNDTADKVVAPPKEIPVEVVQEVPKPPPPKPQPKAAAKPTPPPKPQQVAKREATKPQPKPRPQKAAAKTPPNTQPKPEPKSEPSVAERLKQLIGPMPAIALPSNSAVGSDEVSYPQLVLSKLAKAKKEGRYRGTPGAASVAFSLGDAGEVVRVAIVRPSGDQSLDDEAIAMVKRGAPYPPPPPGGRRDYAITLRFQPLI